MAYFVMPPVYSLRVSHRRDRIVLEHDAHQISERASGAAMAHTRKHHLPERVRPMALGAVMLIFLWARANIQYAATANGPR